MTSTGNPCRSDEITRHGRILQDEQDRAAVFSVKAAPVFSDKLSAVIRECHHRAIQAGLQTVRAFSLTQDAAFFALLWCSGSRGGNLDKVHLSQLSYLPNNSGVVIRLYQHKTSATLKKPKNMLAANQLNVWMNPVMRVRVFCSVRRSMETQGLLPEAPFFFRTVVKGAIKDVAFDIRSLNGRLEEYLSHLGMFVPGERVHGIRGAERLEKVVQDGDASHVRKVNDWADASAREGYLDLAEQISMAFSKDQSFRQLTEVDRLEYVRRIASGDLERVVSM